MAIRFGNSSGIRTRTDLRINEGELDCGNKVYMFIKNIERSRTYEDDQSFCSIGVVNEAVDLCFENASLRIREEAMPKYKPVQPGITAPELETWGNEGRAATELACTPIKIKTATIELSASYRDIEVLATVDQILTCTTADGAVSLTDLLNWTPPSTLNFILTTDSVDQPADDFGTRNITYTAKIPYPEIPDRTQLTVPNIFGVTVDTDTESVEIEGQLRQGDVPMRTVTITTYGILQV